MSLPRRKYFFLFWRPFAECMLTSNTLCSNINKLYCHEVHQKDAANHNEWWSQVDYSIIATAAASRYLSCHEIAYDSSTAGGSTAARFSASRPRQWARGRHYLQPFPGPAERGPLRADLDGPAWPCARPRHSARKAACTPGGRGGDGIGSEDLFCLRND